jgi:homospermidine synthase
MGGIVYEYDARNTRIDSKNCEIVRNLGFVLCTYRSMTISNLLTVDNKVRLPYITAICQLSQQPLYLFTWIQQVELFNVEARNWPRGRIIHQDALINH